MTVTAPNSRIDVERTDDTVQGRFALKVPTPKLAIRREELRKPAFAVAGLADLALEQIKDVPGVYAAEVQKASERLAEVPSVVRTLPDQVKDLRSEVEARVAKAQEAATDLYAQLAIRGERVVTSIRRQPSTEAAIAEGKEAVKKAEQALTAVRKAAQASEQAVEDASAKIG